MRVSHDKRVIVWPVAFFLLSLFLWQVLVPATLASYLIPRPLDILRASVRYADVLWKNACATMFEAVAGFLLANAVAFLLAVCSSYSRTAERIVYPYAIALKTAPIVAMAPILVVWFGTGMFSKVIAAAVICFFPMLINCIRGLRRVDPDALDLFLSLGASGWDTFFLLRLPNALPYIFSALKISSSLAIVGAVVGEFVGAQRGLGYLITISSYHFEVAEMFAAVLAASVGGMCFFALLSFLEWYVVPWSKHDSAL